MDLQSPDKQQVVRKNNRKKAGGGKYGPRTPALQTLREDLGAKENEGNLGEVVQQKREYNPVNFYQEPSIRRGVMTSHQSWWSEIARNPRKKQEQNPPESEEPATEPVRLQAKCEACGTPKPPGDEEKPCPKCDKEKSADGEAEMVDGEASVNSGEDEQAKVDAKQEQTPETKPETKPEKKKEAVDAKKTELAGRTSGKGKTGTNNGQKVESKADAETLKDQQTEAQDAEQAASPEAGTEAQAEGQEGNEDAQGEGGENGEGTEGGENGEAGESGEGKNAKAKGEGREKRKGPGKKGEKRKSAGGTEAIGGEKGAETEGAEEELEPIVSLMEVYQANHPREEGQQESGGAQTEGVIQRQNEDDEDDLDLTPYISAIQAKAAAAIGNVSAAAESLSAKADAQTANVKASIRSRFKTGAKSVRKKYAKKRGEVRRKLDTLRTHVRSAFLKGGLAIAKKGGESKAAIDGIFLQHRSDITESVDFYVAEAETLRTESENGFRLDQFEQAGRARLMGRNRARTFPTDERGQVQRDAVTQTANETAEEIENHIEDNVAAVTDVASPLPEDFRTKGDELRDSVDDHKQPQYDQVDEQVRQQQAEMTRQMQSILTQIDTMEARWMADLLEAENATLTDLQAEETTALRESEGVQETLKRQVGEAAARVTQSFEATEKDAIKILFEKQEEGEESVGEFTSNTLKHYADTETETVLSMREGYAEQAKDFDDLQSTTVNIISEKLLQVDAGLLEFDAHVSENDEAIRGNVTETMTTNLAAFDEMTMDFHLQIEDALWQNILTLEDGFVEMLAEADLEIQQAIADGLAKNQEALDELPGKMTEAAEEAAWDFDHPILSTLASIGSFIGGLLLGILMVLAIVVVVIVLFKVAVAGLIAIGFTALAAKFIVAFAAIAMLGYAVYSSYSARREAGQSGWGAFWGALGDVTGISDIYYGFTAEGESPFWRGFFIGKGLATVATFIFGRRINARVNRGLNWLGGQGARFPGMSRFARFVMRPHVIRPWAQRFDRIFPGLTRAVNTRAYGLYSWGRNLAIRGRNYWNRVRGRQPAPDRGLSGRGYRPKPGERNMTRQQWRDHYRQQRSNRYSTNGRDQYLANRQRPHMTPQQRGILIGRGERHLNYLHRRIVAMLNNRSGNLSRPMMQRLQQMLSEIAFARTRLQSDPDWVLGFTNHMRGRLYVIDEIATMRTGLNDVTAAMGVNPIRRLGGRNAAFGNYNLQIGGNRLNGEFQSLSGGRFGSGRTAQDINAALAGAEGQATPAARQISGRTMVPEPGSNTKFPITRTGAGYDSEAKFFEWLFGQIDNALGRTTNPNGVYPQVRGRIYLVSEMTPCSSCDNIIAIVRRMLPNVEIRVNRGMDFIRYDAEFYAPPTPPAGQ